MKKKIKAIFLGSVFLFAGILGLAINENKVLATVGETFYENFTDSNLAEIVASRSGKQPTDIIQPTDVTALTNLYISGNYDIRDLSGIETFTALQTLMIYDNPIEVIPDRIDDLTALRTLSISNSVLTSIPDTIGNMTQLRYLIFYEAKLTALPSTITNLYNLEGLHVDYNPLLTDLPDFSGNYPNFRELSATNCGLTAISDANISALINLKYLALSDNQLAVLPDSIGTLLGLTSLKVSGNQLETLPNAITQLTALDTLDLYDNELVSLPTDFGNLNLINYLSLSNNQLTTLPDSIGQMNYLSSLDLSNNNITSLPDTISDLIALNGLNLSNNGLSVLPENIGLIPNLNWLDLSLNNISNIPESFSGATGLQSVYLNENGLIQFPTGLDNLPYLNYLNLDHNEITTIPSNITSANFPLIYEVSLVGNKISGLPTFDSDVNFILNLNQNQLTQRLMPDDLNLRTSNQTVTMPSISFEKVDASDLLTIDVLEVFPPIITQYEEQMGSFSNAVWTVKQPDTTVVTIQGGNPDAMDLINDALSTGFGNYELTLTINLSPPTRMFYSFLEGSVYELPITVNAVVDETLLNGSVKDKATNLPIENATIELKENNSVVGSRTTGADGLYEFLDPEAKTYDIIASATGYKTVIGTVTVPAGETVTKNFLLEAGEGTIIEKPEVPGGVEGENGQITGSSGLPKTGNQVMIVAGFMSLFFGIFLIRKITE